MLSSPDEDIIYFVANPHSDDNNAMDVPSLWLSETVQAQIKVLGYWFGRMGTLNVQLTSRIHITSGANSSRACWYVSYRYEVEKSKYRDRFYGPWRWCKTTRCDYKEIGEDGGDSCEGEMQGLENTFGFLHKRLTIAMASSYDLIQDGSPFRREML